MHDRSDFTSRALFSQPSRQNLSIRLIRIVCAVSIAVAFAGMVDAAWAQTVASTKDRAASKPGAERRQTDFATGKSDSRTSLLHRIILPLRWGKDAMGVLFRSDAKRPGEILDGPSADGQDAFRTEITFCNFKLAEPVKQAHASFDVIYSFGVDEQGRPTAIRKVSNEYVDESQVVACINKWRLAGMRQTDLVMSLRWEHGVGWTRLSVSGKSFSHVVHMSGSLN